MAVLLQVDFPFEGPWGAEMASALQAMAESINQEPGFIWKIWTENRFNEEAGGIYLFDTEENALAYLDMHRERLKSFGISQVNGKLFAVNEELSRLNKAEKAIAN